MVSTMSRFRHNNKIFKAVITSYSIYMMNNFIGFKFSTKKLFHKVSMFIKINTITGEKAPESIKG